VTRTIVYIDGFNLYYRVLKGTAHKWLNLEALCRAALPSDTNPIAIHYYTARISGRLDGRAPARQHAYLRALETLPSVTIHYGNFMVKQLWAGIVPPPTFQPPCALPGGVVPEVAWVWRTEEKGSDVNLGVHLVRDALRGTFDEAVVLTNDTDLVEPIRIVTQEANLPVTLLTPVTRPAMSLTRVATHIRHVQPYVGPCQFPPMLLAKNGKTIVKPASW
jgi:uncharacterized LabA/DUF88 family protein